jgi:hypothetical protein
MRLSKVLMDERSLHPAVTVEDVVDLDEEVNIDADRL